MFGPTAKRFKYDRSGATPFELMACLCLSGRHLKEPLLLPVADSSAMQGLAGQKENDYKLVRFRCREPWVTSVCAGRATGGRLVDESLKRIRIE